ncbi:MULTISPECIES: family 78 glycoside hydrolase catalytic domain [unclassified Arcicella]|uniref:alpha-L-rhamnosidase n=1 Tax=unclassified Arcicella TaxID=2644986 RepID=UPI00285A1F67|nr:MULTISPECIES: family 78 glycoside hydrolase catalytic domain [unclassified Arcicella]MDR6561985.1 alpha-L-rhamnosidase [Arcicella sp. BE51]MDR6811856.1 alpha-L-rhamnosidase [Arcicella sp. BE140]MDR6822886.1 alpha-L-rhamnosidase [Arcicella sp. BE139]
MKITKHIFLFVAIVLFASFSKQDASIQLQNLRCEMLVNPEGIDVVKPRLSWEITTSQRNVQQVAYQILVASTPEKLAANEGDLWNSGKVLSDESIHVKYAGIALKSKKRCFWKIKTWTNKGESAWSETAFWSVGLLNYVDWKGRWIGLDRSFEWDNESQFARLSARYFRKEFVAQKSIKQATVYIVGLGLYELYLNGQKVGDQVLAPVPTDYTKGVKYNTFDVTKLLQADKNVIGTVLGNGRFYTMRQDYKPYKIKTFGYPKMLLNLDIEYTDGTKETISTDESWKVTADGPIRANNEYDGEEYDATKEMPNWNKVGFEDKNWLKVQLVQEAGGMFEAQMTENMKVMETIKPVSIKSLNANTYILDMGQNMAGWLRMRVTGKKGHKIGLRFAETLQSNGELFVRNLRDAKVTDVYTLKGEGQETWEPSFVYHGFRYVEITGFPTVPTVDNFDGRVVYDDMATIGDFETSDKTINQIYKNAYWGIRSNYKGMPVDCPQRNERQPWLGDRTTGAYGESFIFDNVRLYSKWLNDIEQAQKPDGSIPDVAPAFWRYYGDNVTWPGTYITVADMLYHQFGDQETIKSHYPSMKKWIDYMQDKYLVNGLITKDKYGDWCVPPESLELIHAKDPARQTDGELLASATYVKLLDVMQNFARLLHKSDDIKAFEQSKQAIIKAFNKKFLDSKKGQYSNGTVTANLLPLMYNMIPANEKAKVWKSIVEKVLVENKGHISTGVIGTQWLMRGLSENGRPDIAYTIASNHDYPSWGYMAENGATTIWELWNGDKANPEMNSGNHVMLLGDLIIWYYENVAGIKSSKESVAFKRIVMKPEMIAGLTSAKSSYHSMYGTIQSDWKKEGNKFQWNISIPVNTKSLVYLPANSLNQVTESGKAIASVEGVKFVKAVGNKLIVEVSSGNYSFNVNE